MKPIDVKSSTYINFDVENNDKDPKLKVSDFWKLLQMATLQTGQKKFL